MVGQRQVATHRGDVDRHPVTPLNAIGVHRHGERVVGPGVRGVQGDEERLGRTRRDERIVEVRICQRRGTGEGAPLGIGVRGQGHGVECVLVDLHHPGRGCGLDGGEELDVGEHVDAVVVARVGKIGDHHLGHQLGGAGGGCALWRIRGPGRGELGPVVGHGVPIDAGDLGPLGVVTHLVRGVDGGARKPAHPHDRDILPRRVGVRRQKHRRHHLPGGVEATVGVGEVVITDADGDTPALRHRDVVEAAPHGVAIAGQLTLNVHAVHERRVGGVGNRQNRAVPIHQDDLGGDDLGAGARGQDAGDHGVEPDRLVLGAEFEPEGGVLPTHDQVGAGGRLGVDLHRQLAGAHDDEPVLLGHVGQGRQVGRAGHVRQGRQVREHDHVRRHGGVGHVSLHRQIRQGRQIRQVGQVVGGQVRRRSLIRQGRHVGDGTAVLGRLRVDQRAPPAKGGHNGQERKPERGASRHIPPLFSLLREH